eukprot:TRINITY_DN57324_c0_g1_i1.p1 TRINITY_DN57324_c0_g1~~TRINITY_DN57324_c0_g1_i1.p1  ORF type:complete len:134 (-),score=0.99 TRINITY_DN57324_c0_g1_i1:36-377(-)
MADQRVTYRRRHSYNTRSNKIKKVRTPGGKLVVHYRRKHCKGPQCAITKKPLRGIKHKTSKELARLPKHKRTVSRPFGGVLSLDALKPRILRAFLVEEGKIVKKVMKARGMQK